MKTRIALPKGRLLDRCLEIFAGCGLPVPDAAELKSRRLVFEKGDVEYILVKDGDVPVYVEFGAADVGIAGLDQILEHGSDVLQPVELPFGHCRLMLIASAAGGDFSALSGSKIATKYPNVTRNFLTARGLHYDIVPLQGSVELAAVLGLAPFIVDLVETGETIRVHDLKPVEVIVDVAPRMIVNRNSYRVGGEAMKKLINDVRAFSSRDVVEMK
jgi:ATP phosphoribosyltransferase